MVQVRSTLTNTSRSLKARFAPSPEEIQLIDVLLQVPTSRLSLVLNCIKGWQFDTQADLYNWQRVLTRFHDIIINALNTCPHLLVIDQNTCKYHSQEEMKDSTEIKTLNMEQLEKDTMDTSQTMQENELTEQIFAILRFTAILLENASNKAVYRSLNSLIQLLGARNDYIVFETIHVLSMLSLPPKVHRYSLDMPVYIDTIISENQLLKRQLLDIVRTEGVGNGSSNILEYLSSNTGYYMHSTDEESKEDTKVGELIYQFYRGNGNESTVESSNSFDLVSIHVPPYVVDGVHQPNTTNLKDYGDILQASAYAASNTYEMLLNKYQIPPEHQYPLYSKIRAYYASRSRLMRENSVLERLYAQLCLFHMFSSASDVTLYVEKNVEIMRGIVDLVRVEIINQVPIRVRLASLQVLTALVLDRSGRIGGGGVLGRHFNVLNALEVTKGTPHGVFPSLIRFCMAELGEHSKITSNKFRRRRSEINNKDRCFSTETSESDTDMEMSLAVAFVQATTDLLSPSEAQVVTRPVFWDISNHTEMKLGWINAVLTLLKAVVSIQTGAVVLTENGIIPALLHVISLNSISAYHTTVLANCVFVLQDVIDSHSSASTLFRELQGANIIVDRFIMECPQGPKFSNNSKALLSPKSASVMPNSTDNQLTPPQAVLLVSLLNTLSVGFHSQGVLSAGITNRMIREGNPLPKVLLNILSNLELFGPTLYTRAMIVVADIINNDPSTVNQIHSNGIAHAILSTLTHWDRNEFYPSDMLPINSDFVVAIPTILNALSLTSACAQEVMKFDPLLHLLDIFTLPNLSSVSSVKSGGVNINFLDSDVSANVGAGIFELMRQVTLFQKPVVSACIAALRKVLRFGDEYVKSVSTSTDESFVHFDEKYSTLLRMATFLTELLEPILSKSEHASHFAELGGVRCLIELYEMALPTTISFLRSSTAAALNLRNTSRVDNAPFVEHQNAVQAITLSLHSYASHQPSNMLTTLVEEIEKQLDTLEQARISANKVQQGKNEKDRQSNDNTQGSAIGILSSIKDVELSVVLRISQNNQSIQSPASQGKMQSLDTQCKDSSQAIISAGGYLRVLATLEWLSSLIVWTMNTAQNHLQSRRWYTEFASDSIQNVLRRLFVVDGSVQLERSTLASLHQDERRKSKSRGVEQESGRTSLWRLGSLMLLRYTIVMRSLAEAYGRPFIDGVTSNSRRGDDGITPVPPYAILLSKKIAEIFRTHFSVDLNGEDEFHRYRRKYYLTFLLESLNNLLFDEKRKHANTLLLLDIMQTGSAASSRSKPSILDIILQVVQELLQECVVETGSLKVLDVTAFQTAAKTLTYMADLENISASPLTNAILGISEGRDLFFEGDRMDKRNFVLRLHFMCLKTFLPLWTNKNFPTLPFETCILDLMKIATTIWKNRVTSGLSDFGIMENQAEGLSPQSMMQASTRQEEYEFSREDDIDWDESVSADRLHSANVNNRRHRRDRNNQAINFILDTAEVGRLVDMGFPRSRVETAFRTLRQNDAALAMEWILAHADEGEDNDRLNSLTEDESKQNYDTATGQQKRVTGKLKKQLVDMYTKMRASFESVCLAILLQNAKKEAKIIDSKSTSEIPSSHFIIGTVADYLVFICQQSDSEREIVINRLNTAILKAIADTTYVGDVRDQYIAALAQLTAQTLHLDEGSQQVLFSLKPNSVAKLTKFALSDSDKSLYSGKSISSCAPVLLILDSMVKVKRSKIITADTDEFRGSEQEDSAVDENTQDIAGLPQSHIVEICLQLLQNPKLDQFSAHALLQLLAKLTLTYNTASTFYNANGVELLLNLPETAVFPAYKELTSQILLQLLESRFALQKMMEYKIIRTMSKLAVRYDSPRHMRITPRILLAEVATMASRNENIFFQALQNVVVIKKSENGRSYVLPKVKLENIDLTEHEEMKQHLDRAESIIKKILSKVVSTWASEKESIATVLDKNLPLSAASVGTYLFMLVRLITSFPHCSKIFTTADSDLAKIDGSKTEHFLSYLMRELLPSVELCKFASYRKSWRDDGSYGVPYVNKQSNLISNTSASILSNQTKDRLKYAHRLICRIASSSGGKSADGSKFILIMLKNLLEEWNSSRTEIIDEHTNIEPLNMDIHDDLSLARLHAYSGIIMSILWPKGTSKGLAWDKVVHCGGCDNKLSMATLLASALRRVDLSHPLAYSTCSMVLRPLATLTRISVKGQIRRHLKKQQTEANRDSSADMNVTPPLDRENSWAAPRESTLASDLTDQTNVESERENQQQLFQNSNLTFETESQTMEALDVNMTPSPLSPALNNSQSFDGNSGDDASDLSSLSNNMQDEDVEDEVDRVAHVIVHGDIDEDDDEDEDEEEDDDEEDDEEDVDDEEEEDDEEDDDDADDDDDEDGNDGEEVGRIRLRMIQGIFQRPSARRTGRLNLDDDMSAFNELDEVDEGEYSYIRILEDETLFADERRRRLQVPPSASNPQDTNSTDASDTNSTFTELNPLLPDIPAPLRLRSSSSDIIVEYIMDTFSPNGNESNLRTNVLTFGEDNGNSNTNLNVDGNPLSRDFRSSPGNSQTNSGSYLLGENEIHSQPRWHLNNGNPSSSRSGLIDDPTDPGFGLFSQIGRRSDRFPPRSGLGEGSTSNSSVTVHPLLQRHNSQLSTGIQSRSSLQTNTSLLRELQELTEQLAPSGGSRPLWTDSFSINRSMRLPSHQQLTNLLYDFQLDFPPASGSNRHSGRRIIRSFERDHIFLGRDSRGGWPPSRDNEFRGTNPLNSSDIRSVAWRLERRINQICEETTSPTSHNALENGDLNATSAQGVGESSTVSMDVDETVAAENTDRPLSEDIANADNSFGITESISVGDSVVNETVSETASVSALASTFGESTLQSPGQNEMAVEIDTFPRTEEFELRTNPVSIALITGFIDTNETGSPQSSENVTPTNAPPAQAILDVVDREANSMVVQEDNNTVVQQEDEREAELRGQTTLLCPDGMDPEVFNSLPPEMQAELIAEQAPAQSTSNSVSTQGANASESFSQLDLDMANSSFDRETLEALPEDIRMEVLANERREREAAAAGPADISHAAEMDNASFVASLAPDLRNDILITCDENFLSTLPSEVRAEAMILRERAAFRPSAFRTTLDLEEHRGGSDIPNRHRSHRSRESRSSRRPLSRMRSHDESFVRRPTLRRLTPSQRGLDHGHSDRSQRLLLTNRLSSIGEENFPEAPTGVIEVPNDEEETQSKRLFNDDCIYAIIRLLFMTESIIDNHSIQSLMGNMIAYPLTRKYLTSKILEIITSPLQHPLRLVNDANETIYDRTIPTNLYGSSDKLALSFMPYRNAPGSVPVVAVSRLLYIFVFLTRFNTRFAIELLRPHGLQRVSFMTGEHNQNMDNEPTISVLIELLAEPMVAQNSSILETLHELICVTLTPLAFLPTNLEDSKMSEDKDESDSTTKIPVPQIVLSLQRMEDLIRVLSADNCTTQIARRTVSILKLLNRVEGNRSVLLEVLVRYCKNLTSPQRFKAQVVYDANTYLSSAVLKTPLDELKVLRLLHTLSDICTSTEEFSSCVSAMELEPLWDALSLSLSEARSNRGLFLHSEETDQDDQNETMNEEGSGVAGMVIEGKSAGASSAMASLLARFLPMVEAFFVVNARDAASMPLRIPDTMEREDSVVAALRKSGLDASSTLDVDQPRNSRSSMDEKLPLRLSHFVQANRVLLNLLVREKPSLLESSLAALIKTPECRAYLAFDNKRAYFQASMKKLRQSALREQGAGGSASVRISVRRTHVFEDSFYALRMRSGSELRRKLHVSFSQEEGIDAGGVTREWYMILAREIFNPNYALFVSAEDSPTFQPNPLSYVNKDHLLYFEFVGKVIGKAVADGQLLDAHFTRSFYKHILQLPISYHDMEAIDPEYYRNLHMILDTPIQDLGLEGLTFSAEESNFGRIVVVDLIPNGRNISVTDENKMEYVKLVSHHRMATGIRDQIDAFLKGFHQLVSPELISIFNENELELLISGMPEIDIEDLKANTEYVNFKPTDSVIRWFWNVLFSISQEERALFLQFVTGTSKVPLEGFKALEGMRGTQKFNIHKAFGKNDALPSAHTCFNQLDLPEYENEEKLKQLLLLAIREGSEGFGFG